MAAFNKFDTFVEHLGQGVHDLRAAGHTLKVYATNATPSASADSVKADLAEISAVNGYPSGGTDVQNTWTQTGGTATLGWTDFVWTASGGSFGPFQWIVLYNDTPTSPADPLIGWLADAAPVTVTDGNTYTVDFTSNVTLT